MADNTQLNAISSAGDVIATDEIAGVKHQRVKVQFGVDGSAEDVSESKPLPVDDFYHTVASGKVAGHSSLNKFGSGLLTTTVSPICENVSGSSGTYQTPTSATSLEFVSDDANDTAAGTGAREITVVGLDSAWEEVTQTVVTDGLTPVALGTDLVRLYRAYVSSSGTYASATAGSHAGNLIIRAAGGGATWAYIPNTPFAQGQTKIGAYTVPKGYTGYLIAKQVHIDSSKTADIYFFARENADDVTAPYSGTMRVRENEVGVVGGANNEFRSPTGPFVGPCDVGFMGLVSVGTADASCEFEMLLVQDGF